MVWDVDLIVFFHQTTLKEKVLSLLPAINREVLSLLLAINHEDNIHSTTSLQVQHWSVAPSPPIATPNEQFYFNFDIGVFSNFQPKATRAGDEKQKHMA